MSNWQKPVHPTEAKRQRDLNEQRKKVVAISNNDQLRFNPKAKQEAIQAMSNMTMAGGEDMPPGSNLLSLSWVLMPHGTIVMRRWDLLTEV